MTDIYDPNMVLDKALNGTGICADCPAYQDTEHTNRDRRSCEHHPGYLNPETDIVVVLEEPAHPIQWSNYDSWEDYNKEKGKSWKQARGHHVASLLPTGIGLNDLWITDSVKCPPPYTVEKNPDGSYERDYDTLLEKDKECAERRQLEKQKCLSYLQEELDRIEPELVIAMGNPAGNSVLEALNPSFPTFNVKTARDGGRVLATNPVTVISPQWSFGWLSRNPHNENSWGVGWLQNRPELQDENLNTYSEVVKKSLESVVSGDLP